MSRGDAMSLIRCVGGLCVGRSEGSRSDALKCPMERDTLVAPGGGGGSRAGAMEMAAVLLLLLLLLLQHAQLSSSGAAAWSSPRRRCDMAASPLARQAGRPSCHKLMDLSVCPAGAVGGARKSTAQTVPASARST